MSKRLSGAWFKLVTQRGDDLGVLMVPAEVATLLERGNGRDSWVGYERPQLSVASFRPDRDLASAIIDMRPYHIAPGYYPHDGAVFLVGISPERLSREPGFAFLPSAHYMRCTHTDIRTGDPVPGPKE
jgi:hypothetical protein